MKKIFFLCLVIVFLLIMGMKSNAQGDKGGGSFTLKQCIETSITNNLDVLQSQNQNERDRASLAQAKANLFPNLIGQGGYNVSNGRSIDPFTNGVVNQQLNYSTLSLSSDVTLFNGFSLQNTIKRNNYTYQASKMDWQQTKDRLTVQVIGAYLLALNNEDILDRTRIQLEFTRKQMERLEIMNKEGAISPSLYYDIKGQFAGDQISIARAESTVQSNKIDLCRLMNIPYDKNMKLERVSIDSIASKYMDSPDTIYGTALKQLALVKAADLRVLSSEANVKVARGQMYPTLSLGGNLNTNYSSSTRSSTLLGTTDVTTTDYVVVNGNHLPVITPQNNYSFQKIPYGNQLSNNLSSSFGVSLYVPIFNSLRSRTNLKLAKINLKETQQQNKTVKTQLQQAIEQAYLDMSTAFEGYKNLIDQVNNYRESFRAAEIKFNAGVINSVEYLTVKNNYDNASINLISAKYEYVLRTKVLDYYQGRQMW